MRFSEPTCPLSRHGNQPSSRVDGLLGMDTSRASCPTCVEFFSAEGKRLGDKVSLVQEIHDITGISLKLFKEALYLSLVLMSECHGQKDARRNVKRTRLTLSWAFSTFTCPSSMARDEECIPSASRRDQQVFKCQSPKAASY